MNDRYQVQGRIWVKTENGPLLGIGRVNLLEEIQKSGSITKAAKAMKISYKQAWKLIDSMNQSASSPLVLTAKGGKGGGGATVSATGQKAIENFDALQRAFKLFLDKQTERFTL